MRSEMRKRLPALAGGIVAATAVAGLSIVTVAGQGAKPAKTPWGHPDIQGLYNTAMADAPRAPGAGGSHHADTRAGGGGGKGRGRRSAAAGAAERSNPHRPALRRRRLHRRVGERRRLQQLLDRQRRGVLLHQRRASRIHRGRSAGRPHPPDHARGAQAPGGPLRGADRGRGGANRHGDARRVRQPGDSTSGRTVHSGLRLRRPVRRCIPSSTTTSSRSCRRRRT